MVNLLNPTPKFEWLARLVVINGHQAYMSYSKIELRRHYFKFNSERNQENLQDRLEKIFAL